MGIEKKESETFVSPKKLAANRNNAKLSTGPGTAAGKCKSRFNATTHGMLSKPFLDDANGRPDDDLHRLMDSLREKYGSGDVVTEILIDGVVVDYWRQRRVLESEAECLSRGPNGFWLQGAMPLIHRYSTSNRRGLMSGIEQLEKLRAAREGSEELRSKNNNHASGCEEESPSEPAPNGQQEAGK